VKIISFSLWGNNPKYTVGAIKNAELAKEIYPGWVCRFYCANDVPNPIIFQLEDMDNVEVVMVDKPSNWTGFFWRYAPAGDPAVEVMISRDTDSRLSHREKAAVDSWLESDYAFHIMRDHPWHGFPVLGGMWGVKSPSLSDIDGILENFDQINTYQIDYQFFSSISHLFRGNVIVHDDFFSSRANLVDYQGCTPLPFPTARVGRDFVGKPFNADDSICLPEADEVIVKMEKIT
tara:strand:+ start:58 stop:756 length:699 start_codon:yes stop_codon:yes gene_type:complete